MGPVPQKVLNWMYNILKGEYQNPDRTYSDVAQTLTYNPNFSLRTSVYTFENGHSALLLNAAGTLPVSFRGATYMFPISIWMPQEYPVAAPMGFVTPTKNMAIRPGQYVSGEGRIYHPYLAGWRDDRSNLPQLISVLQEVFAREPPLISKQEQPPQPSPQPTPNGGPPPIPPLPPELNRPTSELESSLQPPPPPPKPYEARPPPQSQQLNGPPPLPPHPTNPDDRFSNESQRRISGHGGPTQALPQLPHQRPSSLRHSYDPRPLDYRGIPSPQRPGWTGPQGQSIDQKTCRNISPPSQQDAGQPQYSIHGPGSPPRSSGEPSSGDGRGAPDSQRPLYPPQQQPRTSQPHPYQKPPQPYWQQPYPYQQQSHSAQVNSQAQNPSQHPSSQPPRPQKQQHQPPTPQPKPPLLDLLTSPFDTSLPAAAPAENVPPPPIPPNPQKDALLSTISANLTERIQAVHAANMSALPALNTQQAALTNTLNSMNHEISQLESLEHLLTSNEQILHRAMRDADNVLSDAKSKPIPDIDKILIAGTVVESQLYRVVVEERAIAETRTFLGRALDRGRIGGEAWARATRGLAREEFMNMALGRKIARGMGLRQERREW